MKLLRSECPFCGAPLNISPGSKKTVCEYCDQTSLIEMPSKNLTFLEEDGEEKLELAKSCMQIGQYIQAKKVYQEFVKKNPKDYRGWYGLLLARTRNLTVRDNNSLFIAEVDKYFANLKNTAPPEFLEEHESTLFAFLHPEKIAMKLAAEKRKNSHKQKEERRQKAGEWRRGMMDSIFSKFDI